MRNVTPLHKDVVAAIEAKRHLEIFTHSRGRILQPIDFQHGVVADGFNAGHYCLMLDDSIADAKKHGEVVCLLPNHGDASKQVIRSGAYTYLDSFNRDLNDRFRESIEFTDGVGTIKLAVCFGNHVFVCKGLTGTAYIVWARYINYTNHANVASQIHSHVPLIINKDGKMITKGIYILKANVQDQADLARIPITKHSPELLFPMKRSIFVAEVRTQLLQPKKISTLSHKAALARVLSPAKANTVRPGREKNPFSASVDWEDEVLGWVDSDGSNSVTYNYGSDPDAGTPRAELYCQELSMDIRTLDKTPPIAFSDGEDRNAPDPFKEEEEEEEKKSSFVPIKERASSNENII